MLCMKKTCRFEAYKVLEIFHKCLKQTAKTCPEPFSLAETRKQTKSHQGEADFYEQTQFKKKHKNQMVPLNAPAGTKPPSAPHENKLTSLKEFLKIFNNQLREHRLSQYILNYKKPSAGYPQAGQHNNYEWYMGCKAGEFSDEQVLRRRQKSLHFLSMVVL